MSKLKIKTKRKKPKISDEVAEAIWEVVESMRGPWLRRDGEHAQIVAELESIVNERLFVGPWYTTDRATNDAIHEKLIALGLIEEDPDVLGTCQNTRLGDELDVTLFEVFAGHWDGWEVPMILQERGLIDDEEYEALFDCLAEAETRAAPLRLEDAVVGAILLPHVRRAYCKYRQAPKLH